MVLTRNALLVAAAVALLCAACVRRNPPVRLPTSQPVAVAFVADPEAGGPVHDVPDEVKRAIAEALAHRNLEAQPVPFEKLSDAYSRVRATPRRFELLKEATAAPLLLLVEVRASFFALVSGRYRWVVLAKLTGNLRAADADPTTRSFEEPVIMVFDHQRGPQALAEAAPRLAEEAGELFDDLLATPSSETQPQPADSKFQSAAPPPLPKDGAIYFVMVDRFANGDPTNDGQIDPADPQAFHGGDLQGVIDHLDHLQSLGVETVWLSPIFKMRTEKFYGYGAFHGYWVEDLHQVEPRFGDLKLLRKLSDELHRRGMKLVLDMVLNHVGPDTPLVTQKPEWFHRQGALEKWDDPDELVNKDVHGLPDFAQEKPEVYRYLLDASKHWIDQVRPDGFRLDAVKHMPTEFWAKYTADIRAHAGDDFLLLGEMLDGDPRVLARTMREGGFNAIFDFPLHFAVNDVFCKGASRVKLGAALSSDRMYPDASLLVTLVDNHDLPRLLSTCDGKLDAARAALLFTLTARGTPSLTWGTEAALEGAREPENRGDMDFSSLPLKPFISGWMGARQKHRSLSEGVPLLLEVSDSRFVYARVTDDQVAVIAFGPEGEAPPLKVPQAARWVDALSGEPRSPQPCVGGCVYIAGGDFAQLHERAMAEWTGKAEPRKVLFAVSEVPAGPADSVRVVGSAPELGGWDPKRAPEVPKGSSHLEQLFPAGTVAEFKLVVVGADGAVKWEDRDNRVLFVRGGDAPVAQELRWEKRDDARVRMDRQ